MEEIEKMQRLGHLYWSVFTQYLPYPWVWEIKKRIWDNIMIDFNSL